MSASLNSDLPAPRSTGPAHRDDDDLERPVRRRRLRSGSADRIALRPQPGVHEQRVAVGLLELGHLVERAQDSRVAPVIDESSLPSVVETTNLGQGLGAGKLRQDPSGRHVRTCRAE
jgi:hypothetical protein